MHRSYRYIAIIAILLCAAGLGSACGPYTTGPEPSPHYDFNVFFGSSDQIATGELISSYEKDTGLKVGPVFTVQGNQESRALTRSLDGNQAVAAYVAGSGADINSLDDQGYVANLSSIDPSQEGVSIPWTYRGYGLVADRQLMEELVGRKAFEPFMSALKAAGYSEWQGFVKALSAYINDGKAQGFKLNGISFSFVKEKGDLAKGLNGVYALAGASDASGKDCAQAVLEQALRTISEAEWNTAKKQPADKAEAVMDPGLSAFVTGLDDMTSNLAGMYGAGIRGTDFINPDYYSPGQAMKIFMSGKAAFLIADDSAFGKLNALNAAKAQGLTFLPIKMPYSEYGLPPGFPGGMPINQSIAAEASSSFYINGKLPERVQKEALDFVQWLTNNDGRFANPLQESIQEYYEDGAYYPYAFPFDISAYENSLSRGVGLDSWLSNNVWGQQGRDSLRSFMFDAWYKN